MINCSVFILIGGESKRFGSTKYLSEIYGEPIINRIFESCKNFKSYTLVGKCLPIDLQNKPFLKDFYNIKAPINGLYTALEYSETEWILLLSSDLPLIDKNIFTKMWQYRNNKKNIIIPKIKGVLQPTCAFYNKKIKNACYEQIDKNDLSLINLIKRLEYYAIDFSEEPDPFFNMNTEKDLRAAKKILSSKKV